MFVLFFNFSPSKLLSFDVDDKMLMMFASVLMYFFFIGSAFAISFGSCVRWNFRQCIEVLLSYVCCNFCCDWQCVCCNSCAVLLGGDLGSVQCVYVVMIVVKNVEQKGRI